MFDRRLLPCHRVIGKNGQLVGYSGGMWRKQFLLNLEMKTNCGYISLFLATCRRIYGVLS
ncbi:MAG: MGMT family protein [Ignavibacteriaceae bacterium]